MNHYVKIENNIVCGTNDTPVAGYIEAPDYVTDGYELVNGSTWAKGTTLLARESVAAALSLKRANIVGAAETLRAWASFVKETVVPGWDAATTNQKLAWMKQHIDRDATVWNRLADLVEGFQFKA